VEGASTSWNICSRMRMSSFSLWIGTCPFPFPRSLRPEGLLVRSLHYSKFIVRELTYSVVCMYMYTSCCLYSHRPLELDNVYNQGQVGNYTHPHTPTHTTHIHTHAYTTHEHTLHTHPHTCTHTHTHAHTPTHTTHTHIHTLICIYHT